MKIKSTAAFRQRSAGETVFGCFNALFLVFLSLTTAVPFLMILVTSFGHDKELLQRGMILFPRSGFTLSTYIYLLNSSSGIIRGFLNTVFITSIGTSLSLLLTSLMGYALSKRYLPGRNAVTSLILFTMLFNGGLIPTYLIVKNTGLINSLWALIIPSLISVYNMLVMIAFFEAIPDSIEESARIDGAGDFRILFQIIGPLAVPVLVTVGLFYAVSYWNVWLPAVFYINEKKNYPLQLLLRQVLVDVDLNALTGDTLLEAPPLLSVKTATIVIASFPIIVLYPFAQKYFMKGVLIGAVKG